jgi:hypothetical protein
MRENVQLHASATSEQKKIRIQRTCVRPRDGVLALGREASLRSLSEIETRFSGHSLVTTLIELSQVVLYSRSYTTRLGVRFSVTIVTDYPAFCPGCQPLLVHSSESHLNLRRERYFEIS